MIKFIKNFGLLSLIAGIFTNATTSNELKSKIEALRNSRLGSFDPKEKYGLSAAEYIDRVIALSQINVINYHGLILMSDSKVRDVYQLLCGEEISKHNGIRFHSFKDGVISFYYELGEGKKSAIYKFKMEFIKSIKQKESEYNSWIFFFKLTPLFEEKTLFVPTKISLKLDDKPQNFLKVIKYAHNIVYYTGDLILQHFEDKFGDNLSGTWKENVAQINDISFSLGCNYDGSKLVELSHVANNFEKDEVIKIGKKYDKNYYSFGGRLIYQNTEFFVYDTGKKNEVDFIQKIANQAYLDYCNEESSSSHQESAMDSHNLFKYQEQHVSFTPSTQINSSSAQIKNFKK